MPIEFRCTTCGRLLRVSDEDAGTATRCPECRTEQVAPLTSDPNLDAPRGTATAPDDCGAGDGEKWFVHFPDGRREGPMSRSELDDWHEEGCLNRDCQLFKEGWDEWRWADEVYRSLARLPPAGASGGGGIQALPASSRAGIDLAPHRGPLILTFGILSVCTCICGLFSVFGLGFSLPAWIMANGDIKKMRSGVMDREGEGMTVAGKVLGIIHVVLLIAILGMYAALAAFAIVMEGFG